jgi:hypothetical protein
MAVIRVPKTPKKAYDPNRPAGDLLKRQVEHLEWAVRPASQRDPKQLKLNMPRTEGEAAARIAKLTTQLHPVSAPAPAAAAPPSAKAVQVKVAGKVGQHPSARAPEARPANETAGGPPKARSAARRKRRGSAAKRAGTAGRRVARKGRRTGRGTGR